MWSETGGFTVLLVFSCFWLGDGLLPSLGPGTGFGILPLSGGFLVPICGDLHISGSWRPVAVSEFGVAGSASGIFWVGPVLFWVGLVLFFSFGGWDRPGDGVQPSGSVFGLCEGWSNL